MSTWIERSNGAIYVNSKPENVPKGNLGGAGVHIQCESEEQAQKIKEHFENIEKEEQSLSTPKNKPVKNSSHEKISEIYRKNPILYGLYPELAMMEAYKQSDTKDISEFYKQNPLFYLLNPDPTLLLAVNAFRK